MIAETRLFLSIFSPMSLKRIAYQGKADMTRTCRDVAFLPITQSGHQPQTLKGQMIASMCTLLPTDRAVIISRTAIGRCARDIGSRRKKGFFRSALMQIASSWARVRYSVG